MKNRWRASEVIAYLEDKIQGGIATQEESVIYEDFHWSGKLDRTNYALKSVIAEMKSEYEGE
ncbi:hypothetical protein P4V41_07265 [Fictibacillus nanhaiensis]|uniref:hypothetical protein n=1 Tax=Fictibacillus nanhaiensis TaxID=742169 RepID=UPI002E24E565|nr:hypothetical protein [Fictibacillus nanhaiensis]